MMNFTDQDFLTTLRIRKTWTQTTLAEHSGLGDSSISRVEAGVRSTTSKTFKKLLAKAGLSWGAFFCSCMNVKDTYAFEVRDQLLYELYWGAFYPERLVKAEGLITTLMGINGFDSGINRQVVLSSLARLYEMQGRPPVEILDIVKEAMGITYPEFTSDSFEGNALLFCEPVLIQSRANAHHRNGETNKAIELFQRMRDGMNDLPYDDRSRERLYAPLLLDFAKILLDVNDPGVLGVCEEGIALSNKRNRGKYTPDFTLIKAKALYPSNKKESAKLFESACASFSLMRKQSMAKEAKAEANKLGINFETYGMEDMPVQVPDLAIAYGSIVHCNNLGDFFYGLRDQANMSKEDAYLGICSKSTLDRLENESVQTSLLRMESLLERYGRCGDKYFDVFSSAEVTRVYQLRNQVNLLLSQKNYTDARPLLNKLAKEEYFTENIGLQYIKLAEAQIYCGMSRYDGKHLEMLKDAWSATGRAYDEDRIATTRLAYSEIVTLNQIGLHFCQSNEKWRGVVLLENLHRSMSKYYVDELERVRLLPTVQYNLSKHIGRMGALDETYRLSVDGDEMCVKHSNVGNTALFALNRAYVELERGNKEKCLPIFLQAYHTFGLVDNLEDQEIVRKHVMARLGIDFGASRGGKG